MNLISRIIEIFVVEIHVNEDLSQLVYVEFTAIRFFLRIKTRHVVGNSTKFEKVLQKSKFFEFFLVMNYA